MPLIPALWEVEAGESPEVRSLLQASLLKILKISQTWQHAPVIPAT